MVNQQFYPEVLQKFLKSFMHQDNPSCLTVILVIKFFANSNILEDSQLSEPPDCFLETSSLQD